MCVFCPGLFCAAGCAKTGIHSNRERGWPIAPTIQSTPTARPRQPALPTSAGKWVHRTVYQQPRALRARRSKRRGATARDASAMLPFLSMYAIDKANGCQPARITSTASRKPVPQTRCVPWCASIIMSIPWVYTDGSAATRSDWTVYLVSWPEGVYGKAGVKRRGAGGSESGIRWWFGRFAVHGVFPWLLNGLRQIRWFSITGMLPARISPFGNLQRFHRRQLKSLGLQAKQVVFAPASEDWKNWICGRCNFRLMAACWRLRAERAAPFSADGSWAEVRVGP